MGKRSRGPKPLNQLLSEVVAEKGFGDILGSAEREETWKRVVPPTLSALTRVGQLHHGRLDIYTENSVVLQELAFLKSQLLSGLRRALPHQGISDLRFRIAVMGNEE